MKKLFLFTFLLFSTGFGYCAIISINSPVSVTQTGVTLSSSTLSAQTGGWQNCINNASLMSTTVSNMSIINGPLNGGTTIWQILNVPASTVVYPIGLPISNGGEVNALCADANSVLVVQISSGTKSINYNSFIRR